MCVRSDQRFFVRGGIEQTIVYGPGNIRQGELWESSSLFNAFSDFPHLCLAVHNKDESLLVDDLRTSIEVMAIGLAEFLRVDE